MRSSEAHPRGSVEGPVVVELSLVLPAYDSAALVGSSISEALEFFDRYGIRGEVILVDDGSTDGTGEAAPRDERVRVIQLPVNRGKGAALRAGMAAATGEIRAFTDADMPYGTEPLLLALHYIRERRFHAVIGDRTMPGARYPSTGIVRTILSGIASLTFRTMVTGGIYDTQCGFKVFRGDVAKEVFSLSRVDRFAVDVELVYLLLKYRLDIKRVPVQLIRRSPSTVRVIVDSLRAVRDIASIRLNWGLGRYRSAVLAAIVPTEFEADRNETVPPTGTSFRT